MGGKYRPPVDEEAEHRRFVLRLAWNYQSQVSPGKWNGLDVEQECLSFLEERMFENSPCWWGLDAGVHQSHWFPYHGLPAAWSLDDAPEATEEDLAEGPDFVRDDTEDESLAAAAAAAELRKAQTRPKPIPKWDRSKRKKEEGETEEVQVDVDSKAEVAKPQKKKRKRKILINM
ncbi:hypothetical protein FB451DRAFT_1167989 [Mycena latifolia]|nr:hypothetical protein FB451DRAFT_1167989 [Mycena latifolia]